MDTEQRERLKGERLLRIWAEATVYTHEAKVFEENQAGEGCDEQERQRKLHAT